jgi:hypothetical protein
MIFDTDYLIDSWIIREILGRKDIASIEIIDPSQRILNTQLFEGTFTPGEEVGIE